MSTLIEKILSIDKEIRCVEIIDERGNLKIHRCNEGVEPLLTPTEMRAYALGVAVRKAMRKRWENKIGRTRWVVGYRDKVCVIVFYDSPIGDTVLVTANPTLNLTKIHEISKMVAESS